MSSARLVFLGGPPGCPFRQNKDIPLGDRHEVRIGSGGGMTMKIPWSGIDPEHAMIRLYPDGHYRLQDLGSRTGTSVDGRRLDPASPIVLTHNAQFRLGDLDFVFRDEASQAAEADESAVTSPPRLADWWLKAVAREHEPTAAEVAAAAENCGTSALSGGQLKRDEVCRWYHAYRRHALGPTLPLVLPYLIDLGSLIAFNPPPIRTTVRAGQARGSARSREAFSKQYQHDHLRVVATRPAVRFIRERLAPVKDPDTRADVVGRFVERIFTWVAATWLGVDHPGDHEAIERDYEFWGGERKALTAGPEVRAFLLQLSRIIHGSMAFPDMLRKPDVFLLAARPRVKFAFKKYDQELIDDCLRSQELTDKVHKPEPIFRDPRAPHVPSPTPGVHSEVRSVRRTNRLEELPDVVPQDLALLRGEPDGRRRLLWKLMNEGLLTWQRRSHDIEVHRRRFLVAFVADVGKHADEIPGSVGGRHLPGQRRGLITPSVHARRLIFEFLGDMAKFVDLPDCTIDIHIHLEPVDVRDKQQRDDRLRAWRLDFNELRHVLGQGRYNDMVEIEAGVPPASSSRRARTSVRPGGHLELIQRVLASDDYDMTLFVFLGLGATARKLLPHELPPRRSALPVVDIVKFVKIGRDPHSTEVATGGNFAEVADSLDFQLQLDTQLRHSFLEDLMGRPAADVPASDDLDLNL